MNPTRATGSPCLGICTYDPVLDLCTGCFRRLAEIGSWPRFSEQDRQAVLEALPGRRLLYLKRTV